MSGLQWAIWRWSDMRSIGIFGSESRLVNYPLSNFSTNGSIAAMYFEADTNELHIGGSFTYIHTNAAIQTEFALFNQNGAPKGRPHTFNGNVIAAIGDGAGGCYIGGDFTTVDGVTRNYLAQINSTGQLTTWNPNANGGITSMLRIGVNVYVSGTFTTIGGSSRTRFAAVNTQGSVQAFNVAVASSPALTMVNIGDNIYLGGGFASVGGFTLRGLALVNTTGTVVTSWNPDAGVGTTVHSMAVSGNDIYVGGTFTTIGVTARNRLAAINATGSLLTWDPSANGTVRSIAISGSNIYVGGNFTSIASTSRANSAAINTSGSLLAWDPNSSVQVNAIAVLNNIVYVPVSFNPRMAPNNLAILNKDTGYRASTNKPILAPSGRVNAVVPDGSGGFYFGGDFASVAGVARSRLAHINSLGQLSTWSPSCNSTVNTMILIGDNIYFGGAFTSVNSTARNYLAGVNTSNSLILWDPNANGGVNVLRNIGSNIYIGGSFTSVSAQTRNRLASVNTSNSLDTTWNPNANSTVQSLEVIGSNIYAVGTFTGMNTTARLYAAAINTSGSILAWDPSASALVTCITSIGSNIYLGGTFTSIAGTSRNRLAAVSTAGSLLPWNPNAGSSVLCINTDGTDIYVGGTFSAIGYDSNRASLARITQSGSLTGPFYQREASNSTVINCISFIGSDIIVGGVFGQNSLGTVLGGAILAVSEAGVIQSSQFRSSTSDRLNSIFVDSTTIAFASNTGARIMASSPGQTQRMGFATIDVRTGASKTPRVTARGQTFNPSIEGITKVSGKLYVGGRYISALNGNTFYSVHQVDSIGNVSATVSFGNTDKVQVITGFGDNVYFGGSDIALSNEIYCGAGLLAINSSGQIINWSPGAYGGNRSITAILPRPEGIYVGGSFPKINGKTGYTVLSPSNRRYTTELGNQTALSGPVRVAVSDGSNGFYLGGGFTRIDGVSRNYLAHINSSGQVTAWNPSCDNSVLSMVRIGDNIFIGGFFTSVGGSARNYLAAINTTPSLLLWNPSSSSTVRTMSNIGDNIYIGGDFTAIGVSTRNRLAAINTASNVLSWDPNANSVVRRIEISGSDIYIGGEFTSVTGTARNYLAAVNTTPSLLLWNPSANNFVSDIKITGTNVYVAGDFTSIASTNRNYIALVNTAGNLQTWSPSASSNVQSIGIIGTNVYMHGNFSRIDNSERYYIGAVNTAGYVTEWSPGTSYNFQSSARTMSIIGNQIILGINGLIGGRSAGNMALVDYSGNYIDSNFSANGNVAAITNIGDNIYISGGFTGVGGHTSRFFTVINVSSNSLVGDITYSLNNTVRTIALDGSGGAYLGGDFTLVNGLTRNYLAHVNSSGSVTAWNPSADNTVHALAMIGTNVYIGGDFGNVASTARSRLAAVNTAGDLLAWNPGSALDVRCINTSSALSTIFIGLTSGALAYNTAGNIQTWNPSANGQVDAIAVIGSNIFVGGSFTTLRGTARNFIGAVDTANTLLTWNPSASSHVYCINVIGDNIYFGGNFTSVATSGRSNFALVNTAGTLQGSDQFGDTTAVHALTAISGTALFLGKDQDPTRNSLRRASLVAQDPTQMNAHIYGRIFSLASSGTSLYIGGSFDGSSIYSRQYFAALNSSGAMLSWNPNATFSGARQMVSNPSTNTIYAAGDFISMNGTARVGFVSLSGTTGLPVSPDFSASGNTSGLTSTGNAIIFRTDTEFIQNTTDAASGSIGKVIRLPDGQIIN